MLWVGTLRDGRLCPRAPALGDQDSGNLEGCVGYQHALRVELQMLSSWLALSFLSPHQGVREGGRSTVGTPPLEFSCRLCPVSLRPPEGARRWLLFVFAEGSGCSCLWDIEPWGSQAGQYGREGAKKIKELSHLAGPALNKRG